MSTTPKRSAKRPPGRRRAAKAGKTHRSRSTPLQNAITASLALLDKKPSPLAAHRIDWGFEDGRTVISGETPCSLEIQALRWQDLLATVKALGEAAAAIEDWRNTHTLTYGSVGLAVVGDRLASLARVLQGNVQTIVNVSPTLRASLRGLEARQAKTRGAA